MDSTQTPSEALLKVAKETLGVPQAFPANNIPKAYIDELKTHLMLYPNDTNFRVTLQPGQGFGKVTCLENGCGMIEIPLVTRVKISDGGKKDGLGSLSAYRHHISGHPTHEANRHARVKAQKNGNSTASPSLSSSLSVKKESQGSLLQRLDASSPFGSPRPATPVASTSKPNPRLSLGSTSASRRVSSLVRIPVKPEPINSSIPLKRTSDVFSSNVKDEDTFNPFGPAKKAKLDTPKKPLSQLNRNTDPPANLPVAGPSNSTAIEDTRTRIREVQNAISTKTEAIDRLRRKSRKTKSDLTRIDNLTRELSQLKRLKDQYNATIPSMSPIKRTVSRVTVNVAPKPEPTALIVAQIMKDRTPATQAPIASGSRLPGHYSLDNEEDDDSDMDVDMNNPVLQRILNKIPDIARLPGAENYDSNGDYHGRGKDMFRGPQAKADDIDKFLLDAGNAEAFDGNASIDKALEVLGLKAQYELLPGMEVALMPHQTIGVAWMLEKERSNNKGGCLADDMGLGKTVQMIATMVKNQSTDPMCKTNLIIAPMALLNQWKMEIEVKTNNGFKCLIYHGNTKPRRKQDILKYDIVLTTYNTMSLEWPDFEMEQKKKEKARRKKQPVDDFIETDSDSGNKRKSKKKARDVGLLFQIDFFRIILDEAQAIRNKRTRCSRSVTDLRSVYRWCLTGTPIVNGLLDAYGYFRFLKVRPWYDFAEFQGHIGNLEKKQPQVAVIRLQAIFAQVLLRRMKDTKLDGKRLIELPPKEVSLRKLEFTQEERDVYRMVEARTQATFNRYLRAGTVLKNYSQVLVLLLRLRQVCSHPCLIQEDGGAFIAADEFDDESAKPENCEELSRARRLLGPEFVSKVKENFKQAALARMAVEKESVDATIEDSECPICFDVFTDAVVTPCAHVFCRECIVNVLNLPRGEDINEPTQYKADERPCPSCRSAICVEKLFKGEAFEPTAKDLLSDEERAMMEDSDDPDMNDIFSSLKVKGKGKAKAKKPKAKRAVRRRILDSDDIIGSEDESEDDNEDDDMSDFIVESDEDEEEKDAARKLKKRMGKKRAIIISDDETEAEDEIEDSPEEKEIIFGERKKVPKEHIKLMPRFLPSTKMKYMMEHLRKLAVERPDEKTLIVSQWTTCLQLVSDYLTEAGVLHVKYQGDMNRSKRDQAVRVFMSKDKARVMLMSLKCGGVGLNLTRANNVISLDLGWSQAIEAQSFDRVHRLGQLRPVEVQRLVISDTVEDRVLAMQERKQNLADGSLGEGSGKKIGKMSVKELASLFGLDHRGRLLAGS